MVLNLGYMILVGIPKKIRALLIFCILKFSCEQIFKTCNPFSPIRLFMILPYWEPLKDNSVGLYTVRKTNWKYLLENTQIKEILCQVGQHYHSALCKKISRIHSMSPPPFQKWHLKIKQIWILNFVFSYFVSFSFAFSASLLFFLFKSSSIIDILKILIFYKVSFKEI